MGLALWLWTYFQPAEQHSKNQQLQSTYAFLCLIIPSSYPLLFPSASAACEFLRIVFPLFFLVVMVYARGLAHRSFIWLCSVHVQVPWLYWELITNGDPHQGEDYEVSGLSPLLIL